MTIQECYGVLEGNYQEILGRFLTEERIAKFIKLFLKDDSFSNLRKALAENNLPEAFRAAHTLKGVCANLSFTRLYNSSHELTELLRPQQPSADIPRLFAQVEQDYNRTVDAIRQTVQTDA